MNLHRADGVPDWEKIPQSEWNAHQRRAAATNGWDTPGNRETIKGAGLTGLGLFLIHKDHTLLGTLVMGYGRTRDLKDGKRADETGTKSPKGEAMDGTTDTILLGIALPVLVRQDIITPTEAATLAVLHGTKSYYSVTSEVNGGRLHPRRSAKIGAFLQWAGLGIRGLSKAAHEYNLTPVGDFLRDTGSVSLWGGIALGTIGVIGYKNDREAHLEAIAANFATVIQMPEGKSFVAE